MRGSNKTTPCFLKLASVGVLYTPNLQTYNTILHIFENKPGINSQFTPCLMSLHEKNSCCIIAYWLLVLLPNLNNGNTRSSVWR